MGVLDHWQPVARSRELRHRPLAVRIAGHPIAVFRTSSGCVGALADYCPHRRMKLSAGDVVGEQLRCRYHGWTFDCQGRGESPGTPKLTACATSYDAREEHGFVWVKSHDSNPPFPQFDTKGFIWIGELVLDAPAPLELVVDNFNEIEHSGTVHANFGYDLARMDEVKVTYEVAEEICRSSMSAHQATVVARWAARRRAPRRSLPRSMDNPILPRHSVFEHWWTSPDGRERWSLARLRLYVPSTTRQRASLPPGLMPAALCRCPAVADADGSAAISAARPRPNPARRRRGPRPPGGLRYRHRGLKLNASTAARSSPAAASPAHRGETAERLRHLIRLVQRSLRRNPLSARQRPDVLSENSFQGD